MNLDRAKETARKEGWGGLYDTIYATSDGHFFLNCPDTKKIISKAESEGLEIFTVKGSELKKPEKLEKPTKEDGNR